MTTSGERGRARAAFVRPGLLGGALVALAAYVVLHSPLRAALARLAGRPGSSTYFTGEGLSVSVGVDGFVVLLALGAAALAALVLTDSLEPPRSERPLVIGLLAFGFVVVPAAWIGGVAAWAGTPLLKPPFGPALTAVPALLLAGAGIARGWRPALPSLALASGRRGLLVVLSLVCVVTLGASVSLGISRPPTGFDALAYHAPMAVYFWRDGNIVDLLDRAPSGFAMAHGGAVEIWLGFLGAGFGESAANVGQLPFVLLGAAAVFVFGRRLGMPSRPAMVGSLAFSLAPMVVVQAGVQLTDLAAAAWLMSAIALASAPHAEWTRSRAALTGLALGLAITGKLAMVPGAAGLLAFLAVERWRTKGGRRARVGGAWMALMLTFLLAVAPWWVRDGTRFGNPLYPAALPFIGGGVVVGDFTKKDDRFVPRPAAWPLYPLLESHSEESGLGPLFVVGALPGLALALWLRRRRPVVLYGIVVAFTLPAWWRLTQHEPRHLLAILGLAFAFTPWALLLVPRHARRWGAGALGATAVFSSCVTFDAALAPRTHEPRDRARFYDEVWGIDPLVAARDEGQALLYNTGYANLSYAGDYALLGPSLKRRIFTMDVDVTTDQIVALMDRHGVEYAYVPSSSETLTDIEAKYPRETFELVRRSTIGGGARGVTTRSLFRLRSRVAPTATAPPDKGAR